MKHRIYPLILTLISIIMGIWAYYILPDTVPIHWNFKGEVDGYGSKLQVALIFPLMAVFMYVLLIALPKLDPRKENYKKFQGSYHIIINAILTFFVLIHGFVIASSAGYDMPISFIMPLAIGVLFIILGNYMPRVKQNYFVGFRTPWALQNEEVWRYTNRFGARMFMLAGILLAISAFLPAFAKTVFFIIAIIVATVIPFVASYLYYKKVVKAG
ncbi:MAG: SdpI family protein [Ectobacillus sp.]